MPWFVRWSCATFICLLWLAPSSSWADGTIRYIHTFVDAVGGLYPSPVAAHQSSPDPTSFALYGVTDRGGDVNSSLDCAPAGCGIAFKLAPPGSGERHWTFTRLYVFHGGSDGATPSSPLVFDRAGNAYGTTAVGGGRDHGVVYQLAPPPPGKHLWTRTKLHDFQAGGDGYLPIGPLTIDASGALYGTASGGRLSGSQALGVVYRLSPPASGQVSWTFSVLHTFSGLDGNDPKGPIVLGPSGEALGLAANNAFKLTPPPAAQGVWGLTILARADFSRSKSLIRTPQGRLCAVETNDIGVGNVGGDNGRVFCLDPEPGQNFLVRTTLFRWLAPNPLAYPQSVASLDGTGSLYALLQTQTLYNSRPYGGSLVRLDPPASGSGPWAETVLGSPLHPSNTIADGPPARDPAGNLYFTSTAGTLHGSGAGNIFQYTP